MIHRNTFACLMHWHTINHQLLADFCHPFILVMVHYKSNASICEEWKNHKGCKMCFGFRYQCISSSIIFADKQHLQELIYGSQRIRITHICENVFKHSNSVQIVPQLNSMQTCRQTDKERNEQRDIDENMKWVLMALGLMTFNYTLITKIHYIIILNARTFLNF